MAFSITFVTGNDEVVSVEVPTHFIGAVGAYYTRFPQLEDDKVLELLESYAEENKPKEI